MEPKHENDLPLSDVETDTVTDYCHRLFTWASGNRARGDIPALVKGYADTSDLFKRGNISLENVLSRALELNGKLEVAIILHKTARKIEKEKGVKLGPGDQTFPGEIFEDLLSAFAKKAEKLPQSKGPDVGWMNIQRDIRNRMHLWIEWRKYTEATSQDPLIAAFESIYEDLFNKMIDLRLPGKNSFSEDEMLGMKAFLKEINDGISKKAHIVHDGEVKNAIERIAASAVLQNATESEKRVFNLWARDETLSEGFSPSLTVDKAVEALDRLLIEKEVGPQQRTQISRIVGNILKAHRKDIPR